MVATQGPSHMPTKVKAYGAERIRLLRVECGLLFFAFLFVIRALRCGFALRFRSHNRRLVRLRIPGILFTLLPSVFGREAFRTFVIVVRIKIHVIPYCKGNAISSVNEFRANKRNT